VEINELKAHISQGNVKGLLLDLDNTVYAYRPAHEAAFEACSSLFAECFPTNAAEFEDRYKKARDFVHHRLIGQAAMHSRLLYFQQLIEDLQQRTEPAITLQLEETYWNTFMHHMQPDPEILDLLAVCKKQGIPVCIVTDLTAQIQHRKLRHLGLHQSVQYMVSSEESGAEKPARLIFDIALAKLGIAPAQAIMVGDSEEKDLQGARNAGIPAVRYTAKHV
jgi:HAD superfamily hydrolase (TIGR01549 family)